MWGKKTFKKILDSTRSLPSCTYVKVPVTHPVVGVVSGERRGSDVVGEKGPHGCDNWRHSPAHKGLFSGEDVADLAHAYVVKSVVTILLWLYGHFLF